MPNADFMRRMERVLSARVEAVKARQARPRRLLQAGSVIAGTFVCFFVLKAAAIAHDGQAFAAGPVPSDAGFGAQVYHWVTGRDPISNTLAMAIRPEGQAAPRPFEPNRTL